MLGTTPLATLPLATLEEGFVCPPFVFDEFGRSNIAVNQPPGGGSDYPFVGESDIEQIIADLYLAYVDNDCELVHPFRIEWLNGFGCEAPSPPIAVTHDFDMRIVDAEGTTVFDSRESDTFTTKMWGIRFLILEWHKDDDILRVVHHLTWTDKDTEDGTAENFSIYIEPVKAILDERAVVQIPLRVRSLRTDFGDELKGNLVLSNGFNTELSTAVRTLLGSVRAVTTILLDVAPGIGDGRFGPACDEEDVIPIRTINNIPPDERGNFIFDATDCYRIERPVNEILNVSPRQVQIEDHTIKISNDCGPCCECQDYTNVFEGIRRLSKRYSELIADAKRIRDQYVANKARFEEQRLCRIAENLRIVLQPTCPDVLGVAVGFCNSTDEPITNLVMPISFSYLDTTGNEEPGQPGVPLSATTTIDSGEPPTEECGGTFRQGNTDPDLGKASLAVSSKNNQFREIYSLGGSYPHFWAFWDCIDPGAMATVTFQLRFDGSISTDNVELVIDAYSVSEPAIAPGGGPPIPGYVAGSGPVGEEAVAAKAALTPAKAVSGLLQEDCCPEESLSEI